MSEQLNGMGGQDSSVSSQSTSPASAPATPSAPRTEERVFKQAEVDSIVSREKRDAVESFIRKQQQQPEYAAQKFADAAPQQQQAPSHYNDLDKKIAEAAQRLHDNWRTESQRQSQEADATRIAQSFASKLSAGKEKYPDYEKVVGQASDFGQYPRLVQFLEGYVDNMDDVVYELKKDPLRLAQYEMMAAQFPQEAMMGLKRLSQSIKDNQSASKVRMPNEPLNQIRPSNSGTGVGGERKLPTMEERKRALKA